MRIDAMVVGAVPLGVDTREDLERARAALSKPLSLRLQGAAEKS